MADSLDLRVSNLEAAVRSLQGSSTTTTTSTTSTSGMSYYPVTETALGLTQDGAWHDSYSAPSVVPSDAKYLVVAIRQDFHGNTAVTQEFRVSSGSHTNYQVVAYADFHIGANGVMVQPQVIFNVGKTFSYFISNDTDYIVTATVQGYFK